MDELRQATDAEVMGWTAKYLADDGEDVALTDVEDVASLVGEAAAQVHEHGAAHLITQIIVWPFPAEAEALITLDLPCGIRLCTLCISHKHLIPGHTQAAGSPPVIHQVLANVLSAARALAGEYETKVSRCLERGHLPHAGQDSPGKPGAPRTIATAATDKPSSHNTSGVRPLNGGNVPQAKARYQAAQARYAQAAEALTSEILPWLAAVIRVVFPDAAWVETHGLYSEDQEQKLQALRLFGPAERRSPTPKPWPLRPIARSLPWPKGSAPDWTSSPTSTAWTTSAPGVLT